VDYLATLQVPEPQRLVTRAREDTAPVGRHGHGEDSARMALQCANCLATVDPIRQNDRFAELRNYEKRRIHKPTSVKCSGSENGQMDTEYLSTCVRNRSL
jgi:hypothetical protein